MKGSRRLQGTKNTTPSTFWVISRVHEVPEELRKWALAIAAMTPFFVLGALRALSVYYAKPIAVAVAIPLVLATIAIYLVSNRVDVGADAVSMQWLGRLVVIPLREIARVESIAAPADGSALASVRMTKRDGTVHTLLVGRHDEQRDLIVRRIRAALLARDGLGGRGDATFLARGGRDDGAWVAALRALGRGGEGGMRRAPLSRDRLWAVVEDADAEPLDRAAAAVAVAAHAKTEERHRLRIAAEASADPRLRIALERSAEEQADEDALVESMVELERAARR